MAQLRCSKVIPFPRVEVFDFLTDFNQLPLLLEDKMDVEVIDGAVELTEGSEYSFVMTRFRVSQRVRWKVSEVVKGSRVTYSQVEGIFPRWEHTLFFEDTGEGGTEVIDRLDYRLPFGILGLVISDLIVRKDLQNLLNERLEKACRILKKQS